ncbi:MAG TPA: hypothetical protein VFT39_25295 [Vicinamibacterales bacterium]|nr:hypothetical protein [Vicinamibacterales bacterium]
MMRTPVAAMRFEDDVVLLGVELALDTGGIGDHDLTGDLAVAQVTVLRSRIRSTWHSPHMIGSD